MYKLIMIKEPFDGEKIEHIFCDLQDGGIQSFPNIESNDSQERKVYLEWLAEGNEPEIIE
jgi:hypothetical protein